MASETCGCGAGPSSCAESDEQNLDAFLEQKALEERMGRIRRKIIVLSGKGGVGKSTVAVNLAVALLAEGYRVGLLDVDIHGPSIPGMLGLGDEAIRAENGVMVPAERAGLKVMSIGFLLKQQDEAVIWRGPMKVTLIKQFLKDVDWGDLDFLIVDSPPGTGDEPLSVCQLAAPLDGAVVVTTPQQVATSDVRKSITFCRKLNLPVLGVVENMSGFVCPRCGEVTPIFKTGGGERMAEEMNVPFLGRVPIDPLVGDACDNGKPFVYHHGSSETAKAFSNLARPLMTLKEERNEIEQKEKIMKIAIPIANGKLSLHFGHCEQFALMEADEKAKKVVGMTMLNPPAHEPGVLPRWLHEQGADVIIAGGMGQRAQDLFAQNNIRVVVGAPADAPEALAVSYLAGTLQSGANACDH